MSSRIDFLRAGGALIVTASAGSGGPALAQAPPGSAPPPYSTIESWIAVTPSGDAMVAFGKVELGTGIKTAIAQLVSDEIDLPFERVHVIDSDTDRTPNQGYTAGSQSLTSGATPVRRAAAAARAQLLALAAERFSLAADQLQTRDGVVSSTDGAHRVTYGALVAAGAIGGPIGTPAMKPVSAYTATGKPLHRVDIPAKVTGGRAFVTDVRLAGMLHGRVVRSTAPGANISSYDAAALASIAGARVVRKGNFIGVTAPSEWAAIRAARAVRVTWDAGTALPAPADLYAAVRAIPSEPKVVTSAGDVNAAFQGATVHAATYHWPYQSHGSIGPSCAVADVRADGATIWSSTQGVFPLRDALAQLLNLAPAAVRVIYSEGAGCYGQNGSDDAAGDAALLSQAAGKPVRVQWMRADETAHDPKGPAMVIDLKGAVTDGRISAWQFDAWSPSHAMRPDGSAGRLLAGLETGAQPPPVTFVGGDRNAAVNYTFKTQLVTMHNQRTAVIRHSSMRGLGGTQNTFANESFVDELAAAAGADPIAFRVAHLDDPRALAVLDAVRPAFTKGTGLAFARYDNRGAYVAAVADVTVERATGAIRVHRLTVAHDCGLIVNPDGLRNQIEGNAIQATSRTLKERVAFDRNAITSVDWNTYPILRFSEVPAVEVVPVNRPGEPILGAGEATTVVIAPAIANAVFAQTGVRLRAVPFTPDVVAAALRG